MRYFSILLVSAFCLLTAGCGFAPVYGINRDTPVGVEEKLALVYINEIPDREGQYLRNALIDRFYRTQRPDEPSFILGLGRLKITQSKLDVTKTSDATRGQVSVETHLVLRDKSNGAILLERDLRAITSFNIVGSEFANRDSADSARFAAIDELARQTELQLGLYFKRQ